MPKTDNMRDYHGCAMALCDWFTSQEISVPKSVAVMAYLIGVQAAAGAENDMAKAMRLVEAAKLGMEGTCLATMISKRL